MIDRENVITGLECCRMNGKGCRQCPYNKDCDEMPDYGNAHLCSDALELLKEQPKQRFFVDSDGKMTPLPIQKHGHWIPVKLPTGVEAFGYKEYTVQEVICSECRFTEDVMALSYSYCPHCGTKMDEEVEQDGRIE